MSSAPTREEVLAKVLSIVGQHVRDDSARASMTATSSLQSELRVTSARLVDVLIDLETTYGIHIDDAEANQARTIEDFVTLVMSKCHDAGAAPWS